MVGVLKIIYEVHFPGDLWLPWVDLQQSELYVTNDPVLWLGPIGWWGSLLHGLKVIHVLMMIFVQDICVLFLGGRVPLQGLSCASVVSSQSVGLVCVNIGLVRIS